MELLTVGIFYEPLIAIACFIEGVVIVVDAKWWSLIIETESIYSSDIPDTICDLQVTGLGGVSFVMHWPYWLSASFSVFHWLNVE